MRYGKKVNACGIGLNGWSEQIEFLISKLGSSQSLATKPTINAFEIEEEKFRSNRCEKFSTQFSSGNPIPLTNLGCLGAPRFEVYTCSSNMNTNINVSEDYFRDI